jgi:CPA1 family monovalent cation:H+ antiporter
MPYDGFFFLGFVNPVMTAHSTIEFLIWLLIAASLIAVLATRLRIPYTVALVIGGLLLGITRHPLLEGLSQGKQPNWLTPDVILIFFLPPLLFEGSLKIHVRHLRENIVPILLFANVGVVVATVITGYSIHWVIGLPVLVALLFGSIISATDPISVLAIFKEIPVVRRLAVIIEAESLFNDGTAVVLFQILLVALATHTLGLARGFLNFFVEVLGGAAIGSILGYTMSKLTAKIDDPQIEITLTTILAYGSYLLANSLHVSGVIATVVAGLMVGNFGAPVGMSARTRLALWSFWEYATFLINSLVFLLIGMEVHLSDLFRQWHATLLGIAGVLIGRALSIYALSPVSNLVARKIPFRWQHLLVWGGLHGSLSLALALSLPHSFPYRDQILQLTFGVVAFSIIVQGLTIKPLLHLLGMGKGQENEYDRVRVRQIALSSARGELDTLLRTHQISQPVYDKFRREIETRIEQVQSEVAELYSQDETRAAPETQTARMRLIAAERSSIEQSVRDGLISPQTAARMIEAADKKMKEATKETAEDD